MDKNFIFPPFPQCPWMNCEEEESKQFYGIPQPSFPPFMYDQKCKCCEEGFNMSPFPFPPFAENKEENKEGKNIGEETKEEKQENPFPFPPFPDFGKEPEKPKLAADDVEKVLDRVQEVIGYFFDAERVEYVSKVEE